MIGARRPRGKGARVPALLFVTDPGRTPDLAAVAARLPRGAGVVFRGFGRPGAEAVARALAVVARRRRLVLLVGADAGLARRIGADGVHLPERLLHLAPRLRRARPDWIVTGAAHSGAALRRAARFGVDAALLSPVFPSRSPSAGRPLGPARFARLARTVALPVVALGGVDGRRSRALVAAGAAGLAAMGALAAGRPRQSKTGPTATNATASTNETPSSARAPVGVRPAVRT